MRRLLSLFATLSLVPAYAHAEGERVAHPDDIIFTRKHSTSQYPAVGMLLSPISLCTATLIAHDMIVSAAHCLDDDKIPQIFIAGDGESAMVATRITFWEGSSLSDIGFATLNVPITTKPLLIADDFPSDNSEAVFVGYGCTRLAYDKQPDGSYERVAMNVGEKHAISGLFSEFLPFVYSSKSMTICPGDSGGPVIDKASRKIVLIGSTLYAGVWRGNTTVVESGYAPAFFYTGLIKTARVMIFAKEHAR